MQELHVVNLRLAQMASTLEENKTFHRSSGLFVLVLSDQRVVDAYLEWLAKHSAVLALVVAGKFTTSPENLSQMEQAASKAFSEAVKLRMAIEAFIFGNRGWLGRGCYYMWSKTRKAVNKAWSNLRV